MRTLDAAYSARLMAVLDLVPDPEIPALARDDALRRHQPACPAPFPCSDLAKGHHQTASDARNPMQTDTPDRILRIKTVLERTGLSRSTMYRKMQNGTFPRNVQISTPLRRLARVRDQCLAA